MNSHVTDGFLACFAALPEAIKARARRAYRLWRFLGLLEGDTVTWFWIGSHADYDRMLERL